MNILAYKDGIIVIIVLLFYDLLDLLLSEDSCNELEFGTERWGENGRQREVQTPVFRIKSIDSFIKQNAVILEFCQGIDY